MQTPVSISFLSVYPHEDEGTFPPLTRLKMERDTKPVVVKWIEAKEENVKEQNVKQSPVVLEKNEQCARRLEKQLQEEEENAREQSGPTARPEDIWEAKATGNWEDVPSDEAVYVKAGGRYYQPLFEYPMMLQFWSLLHKRARAARKRSDESRDQAKRISRAKSQAIFGAQACRGVWSAPDPIIVVMMIRHLSATPFYAARRVTPKSSKGTEAWKWSSTGWHERGVDGSYSPWTSLGTTTIVKKSPVRIFTMTCSWSIRT